MMGVAMGLEDVFVTVCRSTPIAFFSSFRCQTKVGGDTLTVFGPREHKKSEINAEAA